jgi:hypothetical protein
MIFLTLGLVGLAVGGLNPPCRSAEIIARNETLVKYDTGLVQDSASGLEWYPGPDQGMSWAEARQWVVGLDVLGGGWRMPTRSELRTLFRIGDGVRNITPLLVNSGYWLWAGQSPDSADRWLFGFSYGGEGWSGQAPPGGGRAIAVRKAAGR